MIQSAAVETNLFLIQLIQTEIYTLFFNKSCLKVPNFTHPKGKITHPRRWIEILATTACRIFQQR